MKTGARGLTEMNTMPSVIRIVVAVHSCKREEFLATSDAPPGATMQHYRRNDRPLPLCLGEGKVTRHNQLTSRSAWFLGEIDSFSLFSVCGDDLIFGGLERRVLERSDRASSHKL